jgi:spermidine synthase
VIRATVLALTALTGFSALVYEVAWQKLLATLLGSQSEATAATLGLFLGGLSFGYTLFGSMTRKLIGDAVRAGRPVRLLSFYGCVEASIGVWAFSFLALFRGVQALSVSLPRLASGPAFAIDVALCALLVLPPTILMGGTIPVLTQALARSLDDATRIHALVYGLNTAGAFAGALAAGFWLVPRLGLDGVLFAMGAVNLGAGILFLVLGIHTQGALAVLDQTPAPDPGGTAALTVVALLAGFAMMTLQTILNRIGALAFGASQFTFSAVVAVFVLCIALGSLTVSALPRIRPRGVVASQWALVICLILLYPLLPDATYGAHVLRSIFRDNDAAFWPFQAAAFAVMCVALALPIGVSGALLPLLFHHLRGEFGNLGGIAGRLYSWNTVGSLLGALAGGYALLFVFDLDQVYCLAVASLVVGTALLQIRLLQGSRRGPVLLVVLFTLAGLLLIPRWDPERLAAGLFRFREALPSTYAGPTALYADVYRGKRVVFYRDDPVSSVAVKDLVDPSSGGSLVRSISNNGKSDGSVPADDSGPFAVDMPTMVMLAALPAALADRCAHALVIGYGTGVTAGELMSYPEIRDVTVSEISPAVLRAAPLFDYGNHNASVSPILRTVRSDAYRTLLRSQDRFDVVVSEPSNPWMTGVEMLYSREFLEAARSRLTPGGIYVQWFHLYDSDRKTTALIMRTYAAVFDQVAVWYATTTDLLLLGFASGEHALDLERLDQRVAQPALAASLRRAGIRSLPALLAHELLPLGVVEAAGLRGPVHSLLHPLLSYDAARAFFLGSTAELPPTSAWAPARVGAEHSLLHLLALRAGGRLPAKDRQEAAEEVCRFRSTECATFLAAWLHDDPKAAEALAIAKRVRRQSGFGADLDPERLTELAALFGDERADAGTRPVSYEAAHSATDLFTHYYSHAAPFPRKVLAGMWQRCLADAGGCAAGLAAAEAQVGPLAAELRRETGSAGARQ